LLVGVGGGVPHYTDYARHVRLGDVVLSGVGTTASFIYQQCDSAKVRKRPKEKLKPQLWLGGNIQSSVNQLTTG
jgi:hypothetical protein